MVIDKGNFTVDEVEEEYKELVDEQWQWQVKQINNTKFSLVFPSKELLHMVTRGGRLVLPITGYRAQVSEATGDPLTSKTLEVIWVRLLDVPEPLQDEKILMATTLELGYPGAAPIRMRFGCRVPVHLKSHVTIFVNL